MTTQTIVSSVEVKEPSMIAAIGAAHSSSSVDGQEDIIYTINDLLLERTRSIPDEPLVGYPASTRGSNDYVYYTAKDLDRFADGAVKSLIDQGLPIHNPNAEIKIVALLGPSNLDYVTSIFALSRMGYGVLLLSTRLATEAYISLLEKTNCYDILFTSTTAKSITAIQDLRKCGSFLIPEKEEYNICPSVKPSISLSNTADVSNKTAFIIHSSGSTGLPKPIFQTHKACLSNYANGSGYRAFLTLPLYHNHGLSTFFRAVFKGKPIALYNASLPLSETNLIKAMEAVQPESFHGVPYALKLLSESERGISALRKCKLVLFGGSSCPDDLGDKLVDAGVYLVSHYGATEMGQLMTSYRDQDDKAWNYVRPLASIAPYLRMSPQGDGSFECICLDGLPAKVSSNCADPPNSFRTSDTFSPHPTIPNAWKYLGRIDDRVTLLNGEKVLPVPIEHQVRQNEYVREALVFGIGRAFPGMLVVPSEKAIGMNKDEMFQQIWPSIEIANVKAEGFSQIQKEMVEILEPCADYPATDKGTMIRLASYRKFEDLISSVYDRFESGAGSEGRIKLSLSIEELKSYLARLFATDLNLPHLTEDSDFFDAGVDSLQAIKARSILKRELDLGTSDLDQNVVFENPSIGKLAAHVFALRTGEVVEQEDEIQAMSELIRKYSFFEHHPQRPKEVVILTGTTGSLGAHILAQLLQNDNVNRIYCLVRANSPEAALDRVLSTLAAKHLPFKNISKIMALPASLDRPDIGLESGLLDDVRRSLTKIIHSAWAVNFNLQIRSFEKQHIQGVSNLLNLCLSVRGSTPAQFFFCSSISAGAGTPLPATIAEGPIPELEHAQNMGYARSKLVAERIIEAAARSTGMVAKVLRVGQVVGDSDAGIWNTTEAIPLMIQSAVTMGALPALDETPSWLPVDIVARTVIDLTGINSTEPSPELHDPSLVYQLQNPKAFHWTADLLPALRDAGLEFEILGQREWVQRLRDSDPDPTTNPTKKLLDFFAEKYDNDKPGRKGLVFATDRTEKASETLRGGFDVIGSGLIGKMVQQWLKAW
ncbi:Non-canonical non-ribosomal peptide synthetase FUB8 [Lachnellula suecica]|uniref:Non-canonical non-ribosomal peptide synthetase FUB8 n=1 Tax=Lachnellula suecica TaxID=602035 RepID=A0A8T9CDL1_9HELO|nr:Non-canonical non-ribosomal peptide synthetase FUB8 [Lachnellula suecica]